MAHKLPKPMVHVKCGTCFSNLTWSDTLDTFECKACLTKITHLGGGDFQSDYINPKSKACNHPPADSYKKIRHLRLNKQKERYFVVYSYIFFPCSLPKGHTSAHYYHSSCRYSEETLEHVEYLSKDIESSR